MRAKGFSKLVLFLLVAGSLTNLVGGCGGSGKVTEPRPKNIILITIDALRADALSLYGNRYQTSPNMDKIARQGVYFSQVISSFFSTQPAMASLMVGKFPSFEGVKSWDPTTYYGFSRFRSQGEEPGFTSNVLTLAEILKEAGYRTVGFNTNPYLLAKTNFDQGFDQYQDFEGYYKEAQELKVPLAFSCAAPVNVVMPEVFNWLKANRQDPFFLWIHLMDVHFPYLPPEPYNRMFDWGFLDFDDLTLSKTYQALILKQHKSKLPEHFRSLEELGITKEQLVSHMKGLYQGELRYVDEYVKKLWNLLTEKKLLENTLVVITSDHGEEFLEHDYLSHHGFTGGKEEVVKIPLIMAFPRSEKDFRPAEINNLCRLVDISPTILDYAGLGKPAWKQMDGTSLLPLIKGEEQPSSMAWMSAPGFQMIRTPEWKFIQFKGKGRQLFNLNKDPEERVNLAEQNPRKIEELEICFQDISRIIEAESHPVAGRPEPESDGARPLIDEETRKRLRALGYAQ